MKLHLGCANKYKTGFCNVDFDDANGIFKLDQKVDLSKKYPWNDGSIDEIYSNHVFEHLSFAHTFTECYRVLKHGGVLRFSVPHGNTYVHLLNPTHCTSFGYQSFVAWDATLSCGRYGMKMEWYIINRRIYFFEQDCRGVKGVINSIVSFFINLTPVIYERFFMYLMPSSTIEYVLLKP